MIIYYIYDSSSGTSSVMSRFGTIWRNIGKQKWRLQQSVFTFSWFGFSGVLFNQIWIWTLGCKSRTPSSFHEFALQNFVL